MSDYDDWLATTPEDEEDAANERETRKQAIEEQKLDRFLGGHGDPHGEWADYVYDPLSRKGFE